MILFPFRQSLHRIANSSASIPRLSALRRQSTLWTDHKAETRRRRGSDVTRMRYSGLPAV
jgi:hypothetical protein